MASSLSQFSAASWSTGEAVTVNTRALIDKVLARYSSDHTVFRELFQNAADADAKHVVLKWESGEEILPGIDEPLLTDIHEVFEEKGTLKDESSVDRRTEKRGNVGENGGVLANPPKPPPPYFETPVGRKDGASKDFQKEVKRKRSLFSRLKSSMGSNNSLFSSSAGSSRADSSAQFNEALPRFSTTGQSPTPAPPPDTSGYAQSSEVLRTMIWDAPTQPGKVPERKLYRRLIVQNDGKAFGAADWARLKRIAEGNPDETKIGAFGVGFYSVFSECDEPAVFSAGKAMAFYWDGDRENGGGNQLMTRTAETADNAGDGWTVFNLPYRKPVPLPGIPELVRFLATSLIFVKLETISVYVDGIKLFTLEKKDLSTPNEVVLTAYPPPLEELRDMTQETGIKMEVTKVYAKQIDMRAIYVDGIFGQKRQENGKGKAQGEGVCIEEVSLEVSTAHIVTDVKTEIAAELKRAILKPPPKETTLSMVSAATNIQTTSGSSNMQVFSRVVPHTMPQDELPIGLINEPGRVYIGFQTHQTTGFQCHISTHSVIPTVERENIDFNARYVKDWNFELLRMAGILARCMYNLDMQRLKASIVSTSSPISPLMANQLAKRIMQKYAFRETTPSAHVGEIVKKAFFDSGRCQTALSLTNTILVWSSKGVSLIKDVKLAVSAPDYNSLLEKFIVNVPFITKELVEGSPIFVANLVAQGLLDTMSYDDVAQNLKGRVLDQIQSQSLLTWLAREMRQARMTMTEFYQVLTDVGYKLTADGTVSKFYEINSFLGDSGPLARMENIPLPKTCVPSELLTPELKRKPHDDLQCVFGWSELKINDWLKHIVNGNALLKDETFATKVLRIVSSGWSSYDGETKTTIKQMLDLRPCIPTGNGHGICVPSRVHFPGVSWVGTLPVLAPHLVENEPGGLSEDFLKTLGVRKTVELKVVLQRLMSEGNSASLAASNGGKAVCNQSELVNYLLSLQNRIPPGDMFAIKFIAFCSAEQGKRLYTPSELYEPRDELRELGLPIMFWPTLWTETSFAGRQILEDLGLRRNPDLVTLAKIAATPGYDKESVILRERALAYMVKHWNTNSYAADTKKLDSIKFLPTEDLSQSGIKRAAPAALVSPNGCYWNPKAALLGFNVLRSDLKDLASMLKLLDHPPIEDLVKALLNAPPRNEEDARMVFGYMAQFLTLLTPTIIETLRVKNIVPVRVVSEPSTSHVSGATLVMAQNQKLSNLNTSSTVHHPSARYEMRKPPEVYTTANLTTNVELVKLFEFVDVGLLASQFLHKLGAKTSPSDLDIILLLVNDPWKVFHAISPNEYMNKLRRLAVSRDLWPPRSDLLRQMKSSRFLLGEIAAPRETNEANYEADEEDTVPARSTKARVKLVSCREVLVVDDYTSYQYFREAVAVCPMEDELEDLYSTLGAKKLSECVERIYQTGTAVKNVAAAESLRKLIIERTPLFFHEKHFGNPRFPVKDWLSKVQVKFVSQIRLERRIQGMHTLQSMTVDHVQVTTAAVPEGPASGNSKVSKSEQGDGKTVLVSTGWNTYDLAFALIGRLCKISAPGAVYLMDCLLKEDLTVLQLRGYNVHRILREREEEAKILALKAPPQEIKHITLLPPPTPLVAVTTTREKETYRRPKDLHKDVETAIGGAKSFPNTIVSSAPQTTVMEPQTFCDHMPGHQLVLHDKLENGIQVFVGIGRGIVFTEYKADFEAFSVLLESIAKVGPESCNYHTCGTDEKLS